ncbi:hypothetical protein V8E53_002909 [Lactarius tabidus]
MGSCRYGLLKLLWHAVSRINTRAYLYPNPDGSFGSAAPHRSIQGVGKDRRVLHDGFDAGAWGEAWEHALTTDAGIDLGGQDCARKWMCPLCGTGAPKYALLPDFYTKELRQESTPRRRDLHGIFRTKDTSAAPAAGPVGLWFRQHWAIGDIGATRARRRSTQHELLQGVLNPRPRSEPCNLSGGPWYWAAALAAASAIGKPPPTGPRTYGGNAGGRGSGSGVRRRILMLVTPP